jgi:DNA repair protein RecN (Recombination protein N)
MLKSLSISNYALIESLEIDFPDGLVIITGETGAGKSILLGAISLLLGAKADKEILKDPGKNCVVEALFTIKFDQETLALFKDNDLEPSDTIMLRRVVSPTGRTRSFVNDEPVTNRFLKEISGKIIDIHAQHEHLLIANSNFRMSVLDSYAKNKSQKEEYQQHYNKVKDLNSQLESIKKLLAKEELDFEYNQFQYNQLKEASLNAGELEELEGQQKILANAEEIKNSLLEVNQLLNPNDSSIVQILKEVSSIYDKISSSMPNAKQLTQRVESCRIELRELERENIEMAEKTTSDPLRLSAIEERLSLIYDLYKKYHVNSIEGLILVMEDYKTKLSKPPGTKKKLNYWNLSCHIFQH